MQTVRQIATEIVAREGGFVDDPDDPGGATKYGVTIHTMRRLGLDLSGDGRSIDGVRMSRKSQPWIFLCRRSISSCGTISRSPAWGCCPTILHATVSV